MWDAVRIKGARDVFIRQWKARRKDFDPRDDLS